MTPEESARYDRAEKALLRYPGVVAVGFGRKEVGGRVTDQLSFHVFVREKKLPGELRPEALVPSRFEGVPTDVRRLQRVVQSSADTERHSPLIGGISITNFKGPPGDLKVGTLGCFATIANLDPKENVFAISNNHVVAAHDAKVGEQFFQPSRLPSGAFDENDRGPFGTIHDLGKKDDHSFTFPGDTPGNYYVDCATVKLNVCVSSWCDTNCGVEYRNGLREVASGGMQQIQGVASQRVADDDIVFMSGRESGGTKGRVLHAMTTVEVDTGVMAHRVIEIVPVDPADAFSAEGDSGAALLNEQGEIVGLVFGDNRQSGAAARSHACHILPVLDVLQVEPITVANPPVPPAGKARSDVHGFLDDGINETTALRGRFLATPRGAEIMARVEAHRGEVVSLVNHRRPVTVAWHRAQGPAFLGHAIENARHPAHRIPFEIAGVSRRALLERMADVLAEHGSTGLAAAIAAHRDEVLALVGGFDDLHELVGRFEAAEAEAPETRRATAADERSGEALVDA